MGFNLLVADGSEDNPVTTSIRDGEQTVVSKAEAEAAEPGDSKTSPVDTAKRGVFEEYSEATVAAANERGDKTVLFFPRRLVSNL